MLSDLKSSQISTFLTVLRNTLSVNDALVAVLGCRILKIASAVQTSYLDDNCLCLFLQWRYPYSVFFLEFFVALSLRPCRSRCHLEPENLFDVCDVTG